MNVAGELRLCGSPGDRAVILAPQGLDYIAAFLGALQAGLIAVPLSVPLVVPTDERVISVLRDASPSVILTTSAVVGAVVECCEAAVRRTAPSVVEVDLLDPDAPRGSGPGARIDTGTAYLQYTSGSTRQPAGVMVSHQNLLANLEQFIVRLPSESWQFCAAGHHCRVLAALLSRPGLDLWHFAFPIPAGVHTCTHEPGRVSREPARWMQVVARNTASSGGAELRLRTGGTTHHRRGYGGARSRGSPTHSHSVANGSTRPRSGVSPSGSPRFNLGETALRPGYGLAEATVYVANPPGRPHRDDCPFRLREVVGRPGEAVRRRGRCRWSATAYRNAARCGSSTRRPVWSIRPARWVRCGSTATMSPAAIGGDRTRRTDVRREAGRSIARAPRRNPG